MKLGYVTLVTTENIGADASADEVMNKEQEQARTGSEDGRKTKKKTTTLLDDSFVSGSSAC